MSDPQEPRRYDISLDALVSEAKVDPDDRIEEIDTPPAPAIPQKDPMFGYGIHAG